MQISDQASFCPNCGYPIGKHRRSAEAKEAIVNAKLKVADGVKNLKNPIKTLGRHIKYLSILVLVFIVLTFFYYLMCEIAKGNIQIRYFANFVAPYFSLPIFSLLGKMYGIKVQKVYFWVFLTLTSIGVLSELGVLIEANALREISTSQLAFAMLAKLGGIASVAVIQYDKIKSGIIPEIE